MVENMSLMSLVAIFIGLAVFLSIGIMVLDGAVGDCSNLEGYNSSNPSASTGWAGSCEENNSSINSSWTLISVVLIIVSAIVVLAVVKML